MNSLFRPEVFVERLWRSIKYEEVYLHAYDSIAQAKAGIARYIDFYNTARPHSSLDKKTPVPGVNYLERRCCLTKECYPSAWCRSDSFFASSQTTEK